jgi:hypothetical protein
MIPIELANFHAEMATTMKWIAEGFVVIAGLTIAFIARTQYLKGKW